MFQLTSDSRIALVLPGGPENGPYTAQYTFTFRKGLNRANKDIHGIFAVSGPAPTALLGSIHEEERLCNVWKNLCPKDIVGNMKDFHSFKKLLKKIEEARSQWDLIPRRIGDIRDVKLALAFVEKLKQGYLVSNEFLMDLLYKHTGKTNLDRIFSSEAIPVKIAAVDYFTKKQVIFSNRIPEHKEIFILGLMASMCPIPWFPPIFIDNPVALKVIDKTHPYFDFVLLVDGGYRGSLLLEEAIREPEGYDLILVVDIHGLKVSEIDPQKDLNVMALIEMAVNTASDTINQQEMSLVERINEGIAIREEFKELLEEASPSMALRIKRIIDRMDNGRLRLADKHAAEVKIVPSPMCYKPLDFSNFTQAEVIRLMQYGHISALQALRDLGISTEGLPRIDPTH